MQTTIQPFPQKSLLILIISLVICSMLLVAHSQGTPMDDGLPPSLAKFKDHISYTTGIILSKDDDSITSSRKYRFYSPPKVINSTGNIIDYATITVPVRAGINFINLDGEYLCFKIQLLE